MTTIIEQSNVCAHCGGEAEYYSKNSKKWRCTKIPTQCPGFVKKAQASRERRWEEEGHDAKINHMKLMSRRGNERLRELNQTEEFRRNRATKISMKLKERGGHAGENNPNFGRMHTDETKEIMKQSALARDNTNVGRYVRTPEQRERLSALARDNTNVGRYVRTPEHRERLSVLMMDRLLSGRLWRSRDTKPELLVSSWLTSFGLAVTKQFLIQYGSIDQGTRFRHAYDFLIQDTNVLVEVDGTYWHSRPETLLRDAECNRVAEEMGYSVVRIPEAIIPELIKQSPFDVLGPILDEPRFLRPRTLQL